MSITVTDVPPVRARPFGERLAGIRVRHVARTAAAVALVLAATLGITLALQSGQKSRRAGAPRARVSGAERTAIAAALGYPYPVRCLTITISDTNPDYALANVDRTNGCGRYHGYLNASLHRVDGAWRLLLDEGQLFVPNSLLAPGELPRAAFRRPPVSRGSARDVVDRPSRLLASQLLGLRDPDVVALAGSAPLGVAESGLPDRCDDRPVMADWAVLNPPPAEPKRLERRGRNPDGGEQMALSAANDEVAAEPSASRP